MEYEELTLDMIANNESEQEKGGVRDTFGCCDQYKQCSIEGKCLRSEEISRYCSYKNRLEKGEIFYSKKSPNFSQEKYNYIDNWYKVLSDKEREAFGEIVCTFTRLRRCATHVLCGSMLDYPDTKNAQNFKVVYDCISQCDFFTVASPEKLVDFLLSNDILSFYSFDYINAKYSDSSFKTSLIKFPNDLEYTDSDYIGNKIVDENLTEEGKAKKKKRKEYQKKCWKEYLINDNTLILNKFTECFVYITVSPDFSFELDEWASDNWRLLPLKLDDFKFLFVERESKENNKADNQEKDIKKSFNFKKMKSVDWQSKS